MKNTGGPRDVGKEAFCSVKGKDERQCAVAESVSKRAPLSGIRIFLESSNTGLCVFSLYKM
jgi:hypothetical protein